MKQSSKQCCQVQKQLLKLKKNSSNFVQKEAGITVTAFETIRTIPPVFVFPSVRHQVNFFIAAPSGSLASAIKSGWMTAKLFSSVLKHIWQHTHCSQHNPFYCYFITTGIVSPPYQLRLLKVITF
jgi:hypothetical protein